MYMYMYIIYMYFVFSYNYMYVHVYMCTLMCRCIKGAVCGLNPIEPCEYGPARSTRADKCIPRVQPEGCICLPNFATLTWARVPKSHPAYLPRQCKCLLCRLVQKAAMGQQCGLHASDHNLMNIITRQQRDSSCCE